MKALTFCALLLMSHHLNAQQSVASKIDSLALSYFQSGQFSGEVLVADHGTVIVHKTYGYKDVGGQELLTKRSVYEVASLSKSFTAMLVSLFKTEGLWAYDDLVIKHLSDFPYPNITIRHLLSHSSGLSERKFFMWAGQHMKPGKTYHNQFVIDYLATEKPALSFEPGTQYEYSNLGYMLLAHLLEKQSGKHYISLLNEHIFQPLKMDQSGIYSQSHKGENMPSYAFSKVFNPLDSTYIPAFDLAWSDSIYGSVGIVSNASDLLKWDQALYTDQLIKQEARAEIFEPQRLADGNQSSYGLGWFVDGDLLVNGKNIGKKVSHFGLWPGYESSIVRFIDQGKTIIIISNRAPSSKGKMIEGITKLLFR